MATLAMLRLLGKLPGYPPGPVLAAFGRESKNQTDRSVAEILKLRVAAAGLQDRFDFKREYATVDNGSEIHFVGLNKVTVEALRSFEGLALLWVEEAQRLTHEVAEVMVPSVRAPGSELWFTWNPRSRQDWVWQRFVVNPRAGDVSLQQNWDTNPFFPAELDEERRELEAADPELCAHVYGGQLAADGLTQILTEARIEEAVAKYTDTATREWTTAGLDIADEGGDSNCLAIVVHERYGMECTSRLIHVERWQGSAGDLKPTAVRAAQVCQEHVVDVVAFDGGGVGTGMGGELARQNVAAEAVQFGGRPLPWDIDGQHGPDIFERRNAQMAWQLRRRLQGMHTGEQPQLLISPRIDKQTLEDMAVPTWEMAPTSKIRIDKKGGGTYSPDAFDAICLAFALNP